MLLFNLHAQLSSRTSVHASPILCRWWKSIALDFCFHTWYFLLSPLDVVGRVGIDVAPVVSQHYWLNADEACGALDSCQIIQLRKVADARFHPHPHQFIFIPGCQNLFAGDRRLRCGSLSLQVKVLRSFAAGGKVWRCGGGGGGGGVERTGDRCLIRSDATQQHNPPQQPVIMWLWELFWRRKVQVQRTAAPPSPLHKEGWGRCTPALQADVSTSEGNLRNAPNSHYINPVCVNILLIVTKYQ